MEPLSGWTKQFLKSIWRLRRNNKLRRRQTGTFSETPSLGVLSSPPRPVTTAVGETPGCSGQPLVAEPLSSPQLSPEQRAPSGLGCLLGHGVAIRRQIM